VSTDTGVDQLLPLSFGSGHDHFRVQTNGEWRTALHEWILAIVVDDKVGELASWLGAIGCLGNVNAMRLMFIMSAKTLKLGTMG
jgi:hypothetical protein